MFANAKQALSADLAKIKADATADAHKVEGVIHRTFRAVKRAVALHLQAAVGIGASIAAVLEPHFSDIQSQLTGSHVLYFIIGSSIIGWLATASHVKEAQDHLAKVAEEAAVAPTATTVVSAQPVLDALSVAHANLVAQVTTAIANVAPAPVATVSAESAKTAAQAYADAINYGPAPVAAPTETSTTAAQ